MSDEGVISGALALVGESVTFWRTAAERMERYGRAAYRWALVAVIFAVVSVGCSVASIVLLYMSGAMGG